jgi:hypothetical protein
LDAGGCLPLNIKWMVPLKDLKQGWLPKDTIKLMGLIIYKLLH